MFRTGSLATRLAKIEARLHDQDDHGFLFIVCSHEAAGGQKEGIPKMIRGPVFLFDAVFPADPSPLPGAPEFPSTPLTSVQIDTCIAAWREGSVYEFEKEEADW